MDLTFLNTILSMMALGLIFGVSLAYLQLKFGKELDPRIHQVEEVLPKGQCGACGFAGCSAYAEEVVVNPNVPPDRCIPGKSKVSKLVARITGKEAKEIEEVKAYIRCNGKDLVGHSFFYNGLIDCEAASLLFGGDKACSYSCLGYGSCVKECRFYAISLLDKSLSIDPTLCTGCGACSRVCPKGVIELVPLYANVLVFCNSKDNGILVKKICKVGCIGCRVCEKTCKEDAIHVEDNLARILYDKCTGCGRCIEKCPTGALMRVKN